MGEVSFKKKNKEYYRFQTMEPLSLRASFYPPVKGKAST